MVDGKGRPNGDGSSRAGQHEEFLELCALSTSGSLSEEEQKKLREHLGVCAECREAMTQYERVVDCGIPALASELAEEFPEEDSSFSQEDAEKSFFKRLSEEKERARLGEAEPWLSPLAVRRSRNFRRSFDRYRLWLPMAAAVLLCTALGLLTYRMGKGRGIEVALSEQKSLPSAPTNYQKAAGVASQNDDASEAQLSERDKAIAEAYPATMIVSGDADKTCNPLHARKMTARLQTASASCRPIFLDYSKYRGHSPVLPLSERIEGLTDRLAFLCDQLDLLHMRS